MWLPDDVDSAWKIAYASFPLFEFHFGLERFQHFFVCESSVAASKIHLTIILILKADVNQVIVFFDSADVHWISVQNIKNN